MSTKIQINSLKALERLIGDDDTLEIEVRRAVIEAFARGFVKNVANVAEIKDEIEKIKSAKDEAVKREIEKHVGKVSVSPWSQEPKVTLTDEMKQKIRVSVEDTVYDVINKAIGEIDLTTRVSEIVNTRVDYEVKLAVNHNYKKRILDRVDAALKAVDENNSTDG